MTENIPPDDQKLRLKHFLYSTVPNLGVRKQHRVTQTYAKQLIATSKEVLDDSLQLPQQGKSGATDIPDRLKQLKRFYEHSNMLTSEADEALMVKGEGEEESTSEPDEPALWMSSFKDSYRKSKSDEAPIGFQGLLSSKVDLLRECGRQYSTRREDYISAQAFEIAQEAEEQMLQTIKQPISVYPVSNESASHKPSESDIELPVLVPPTRSLEYQPPPYLQKGKDVGKMLLDEFNVVNAETLICDTMSKNKKSEVSARTCNIDPNPKPRLVDLIRGKYKVRTSRDWDVCIQDRDRKLHMHRGTREQLASVARKDWHPEAVKASGKVFIRHNLDDMKTRMHLFQSLTPEVRVGMILPSATQPVSWSPPRGRPASQASSFKTMFSRAAIQSRSGGHR